MRTEVSSSARASRLWQLVSPALPIGGYSYSQGLETAVLIGWITDEATAEDWIQSVGTHCLALLDLPLQNALRVALEAGSLTEFQTLNENLLSHRETAELRAEDAHGGRALLRLLDELASEIAPRDPELEIRSILTTPTLAAAFALACYRFKIATRDMLAGYAWLWFENQVAAAVKLVPLGQSAGQRLLLHCGDTLDALVERALELPLDEVGATLPGLVLASAAHETQYSRLFQS